MVKEKLIRTVRDVWEQQRRGMTHGELVNVLNAHALPENTLDILVKEGAIRRVNLTGGSDASYITYLPTPENMGTSVASSDLQISVGEYKPQAVTESSARGKFSLAPVVGVGNKERLPWYQRVYNEFRREIREIFKHC